MQMSNSKNKRMMVSFLLSDVLIKLGKFLALPLFLIYLSPTDFGKLEYYLSYAAFFSSFLGPGLYNWLLSERSDKNPGIFYSALNIYLAWFAFIFVVTALYSLFSQNYLLLLIFFFGFFIVKVLKSTPL